VEQLAGADISTPIRVAAITGLARQNVAPAAVQLVDLLSTGKLADEAQLAPVVNAVLQQQDGPTSLADALAAATLDAEQARKLLRAVYGSGRADASLIEPLARAAGMDQSTAAMTSEQRTAIIAAVTERGDAARGQTVFRRAELNCVKCHALSAAGGNIGPDLSGVGANSPVDYLVDTLLYPSQQIKEQYLTRNVLTVDGQVVRGIVVTRDDERVILRDAEGREVRLSVEDIEEESDGPSLMPEGLHHLMSEQDLVDLVRFLSELGKPGPYGLNASSTIQKWQVLKDPAWYDRLAEMPEGGMEGALDEIPDDAWGTGYAMVDGTMPLKEIAGLPASGPVILRGQFDVVEAGQVAVDSHPNSDVRIVLTGRSVSPRAAQAVDVEAGRRKVYMVIETPWRPQNVRLQLVRPEGSATQFQVVGGT
jgi:putative heme-binding domain-containing protein